MLVDTRPLEQRQRDGEIPGALLVERNVLEWRLDPASGARLPEATDHDVVVIVVCSEGYSSSLAAASLQDLGLARATDWSVDSSRGTRAPVQELAEAASPRQERRRAVTPRPAVNRDDVRATRGSSAQPPR